MSQVVLPTLDSAGWLADKQLMLTRLFRNIYATDYSQSNTMRGSVTSLQYLLIMNGDDPDRLIEVVESTLKTYFGRYYETVDVSFRLSSNDETWMAFDLAVEVSAAGRRYDLKERLLVDKSSGAKRFQLAMAGE